MTEIDAIIEKIDGLEGCEQQNAPWLLSLLNHENNMVRYSALRPLIYRCSVPNLTDRLRALLETEPDEDVLLLVISALSERCRGSMNSDVIRRFQQAIERIGGGLEGTRETFEDAKLRVMLSYDTKQIVKMSSAERMKRITDVNEMLETQRSGRNEN